MSKRPERRPSRPRTKDPGKTKDQAMWFWGLFHSETTLIAYTYPKMKKALEQVQELAPFALESLPEPWAALVKLQPFKLPEEQWADIAKLGPPKLTEARAQVESAVHLAQVVSIYHLKRPAEESERMASKRREAQQIHVELKRVTDRIEAFGREETTIRDFQQGMKGLRYILDYFRIESKARLWPDYDKDYDWALYYLIRALDFVWKEHTGQRVRRSVDGTGNRSEAYVVELCKIALNPIEESTINNALRHYITARRLAGVSANAW